VRHNTPETCSTSYRHCAFVYGDTHSPPRYVRYLVRKHRRRGSSTGTACQAAGNKQEKSSPRRGGTFVASAVYANFLQCGVTRRHCWSRAAADACAVPLLMDRSVMDGGGSQRKIKAAMPCVEIYGAGVRRRWTGVSVQKRWNRLQHTRDLLFAESCVHGTKNGSQKSTELRAVQWCQQNLTVCVRRPTCRHTARILISLFVFLVFVVQTPYESD
jgi:hypothetical protein